MSRNAGLYHLLSVLAACLFFPAVRAADPAALVVQQDASLVTVSAGPQPVLTYRYGDAPFKPYVKELHSPAGVQILRDSPADHVHHRGLMYGIFVNGIDFWSEQAACGKQVHVALELIPTPAQNGLAAATIGQRLRWLAPGAEQPLLVEQRTLKVFRPADLSATLLTWQCQLQPGENAGTVKLTGNHYDGLGVRFVQSMDQVGRFSYAAGIPGDIVRGTERLTRDKWAAYTAPAEGRPVTVAVFDDPQNPRHPAGIFTMLRGFSYLSATPNIWKSPLELGAGQSLSYRYGVAVWDGEVGKDQIEALYQCWLKL